MNMNTVYDYDESWIRHLWVQPTVHQSDALTLWLRLGVYCVLRGAQIFNEALNAEAHSVCSHPLKNTAVELQSPEVTSQCTCTTARHNLNSEREIQNNVITADSRDLYFICLPFE